MNAKTLPRSASASLLARRKPGLWRLEDAPVEEQYAICVTKGNTELLEDINAVLAKAMAADLYDTWYEACQIYAEVKTADELGYDDEGNKITE